MKKITLLLALALALPQLAMAWISKVLKTAVTACDFLGCLGCKNKGVFVTANGDVRRTFRSH